MPKKWNQVYTERAEEIKRQWAERDRIESEERELMLKSRRERMENLKRIESLEYPYENNDEEEEENQLVNSPVKSKYKKPIMDCKRTIYNLAPPASQMDWHEHWGSSLLCYICDKPAVTEMTRCPKCNVVAHILCVNSQPMRYDRPDGQDLCPHCEESRRKEQEFYEQEIERLKYQRLLEISAAMVTRRALVYLAMKRYDRTRQSIRRIQAVCRGIIARLRYRIQRRAFLRVVLLSILHLPNIPEQVLRNGLMVVTIMDTFKGNQIFRFDQSLETVLEEKILIPGLASYMTMVFTLCTKEEVYTYSMIAQAQLCIRDMVNPSKRKDVNLNFLEKIQVIYIYCVCDTNLSRFP